MCLAVPGRVLSVEERDGTLMAEVDFGGVHRDTCVEYVPDVRVGEYVLVHVGFAIQRLDERSAMETLSTFEELGALERELDDGSMFAEEPAGAPVPTATPHRDG